MLFRLASPMRRKGTQNVQLVKRLPADVRHRLVGRELSIPIGEGRKLVTVTERMQAIRASLGTADPATAKMRQAEALAYIEQAIAAARPDRPLALTGRQAEALAGRLYRSWASSDEGQGERSRSITFDASGNAGAGGMN